MRENFAAIAVFLQMLPLFTEATVLRPVDPKDVVNIDGRRYYFSTIFTNIPDAITVCQELNMTLTALETQKEYDAVTDYIKTSLVSIDGFFTSGNRQHTMWLWSNTGKPISYFNWDVGQPQNRQDEYNLAVRNGRMDDWHAYATARFICEETTSC